VFKINTDGTGFSVLHSFDSFGPNDPLVLSGGTLYGAGSAGSFGSGTVFALNIDGTGFTNIYTFSASSPLPFEAPLVTNIDGVGPGGLFLSGNTLYGTTVNGNSGYGSVFKVNTNGTGFVTLHVFDHSEGPAGRGVFLSDNTLYGTTDYHTAFSLTLPPPPQLTILPVGDNVTIRWPTNNTGFTLYFSTNLVSPVWDANLPAPVVVNGQNVVTNPISGTQQFFRLSQ
jgi:uncharacterized repeat protein (TIGR03803 family)